eukprot:scaffold3497_cov103-Alexandrium_tamarense.AAC.2
MGQAGASSLAAGTKEAVQSSDSHTDVTQSPTHAKQHKKRDSGCEVDRKTKLRADSEKDETPVSVFRYVLNETSYE